MSAMRMLRVEIGRTLRSPWTWLAIAIFALGLLGGLLGGQGTTMKSMTLAEPTKSACITGAVAFALLTLFELSRVHRGHMDAIVEGIVSPIAQYAAKLAALLCAAAVATAVTMLAYLPLAIGKLDIVFTMGDYVGCFLLYAFPAMGFGCLAAATAYQIVRRVDVSALAVLAFLLAFQGGLFGKGYLWPWCQPYLLSMSDDFSNAAAFRMAAMNRIVWLALLGGAWALSLLCVRRYGKGLFGSLVRGLRTVWMPALGVVALLGGVLLWHNEPLFDRSPIDWMNAPPPQSTPNALMLESTQGSIDLSQAARGWLTGDIVYRLRSESEAPQTLDLSLNSGYAVERMIANGQEIAFEDLQDDYISSRTLRCTLPAAKDIELRVEYGGAPQYWNASQELLGSGTVIDSAYIQLKGRTLSPTCTVNIQEGAPFTMDVTLPGDLSPVTSGFAPQELRRNADGTITWRATDVNEDNMTLFAGDFVKVDLDAGTGMPIEFYYSRKHHAQIMGMDAIATMEAAVRYCTAHIGPRSFTADKPFKIVQGTELLFGGFASQNISAMSEASFTAVNLADQTKGATGAEVLAHEIIHQWWGLGAMLMDEANPYWSSEGITTYTTYRLLKELRGEAYADEHYKARWEQELRETHDNFYVRHPEYRDRLSSSYAAQLDMRLAGVNEYSGYALAFHRAASRLGEEALDRALSDLYEKNCSFALPYLTLQDVLDATRLTKGDLGLEDDLGL